MGWLVRLLACCLALGGLSCVDVEGGDRGTYTSPCGSGFGDILLCGRESGGADPNDTTPLGDTGDGATCASICMLFLQCGFQVNVSECTFECTADNVPQSLLDCFQDANCNFDSCVQ